MHQYIEENKIAIPESKRLPLDTQKADQYLKTIFDYTETAYLLLDQKLIILAFNLRAEKWIYQVYGKKMEKGRCIIDIVPKSRTEMIKGDYEKALQGKHLNYESNFPGPFGRQIWYNFQLSPVMSEQNKVLGLVVAISDITKRKNAEIEKEKLGEALKASHLGLKKLVAHVQSAKEEERLHIAREVHDELGQLLTTTKIELSMINKKLSHLGEGSYIQDELFHVIELINKSIKSVKKIATDLRPEMLDELGLLESIRWQIEEFTNNKGVVCKLSVSPEFESLTHDINLSTTMYRIVQEALTNIARHAQATQVNIVIKTSIDNIFMVIQDNGIGISEEAKNKKNSFGLTGLRERVMLLNGIIDFTSRVGEGTVVYVQIPYMI